MTNIQKVAQLANVSVATVSRVMNNSDKVSPKTRKKVEEAVEKMNYIPNMLGRNFRLSESRSIVVMITSISNLFYMEIVHGISDVAYEKGYDILLNETNGDRNRQLNCLLKIKNRVADGAIIVESTVNDKLLLSIEKNYPVVQCSADSDNDSVPSVNLDNRKGGYIATKHLISHKHRSIAFIGTNDALKYNRDRKEGFLQAIAEAGITRDEVIITNADLSFDGGRRSALELMKLANPPTALFYVSDMQAVGAMSSLASSGKRIPQDVAVIGYDNIEICNMVLPGLTTISQPMYQMGRESARLLLDRINNNKDSSCKSVIFQPELVIRGSV